jgi:hypothetical protein
VGADVVIPVNVRSDVEALLRDGPLPPGIRFRIGREIVLTYIEVRRLMRREDIASVVATLRAGANDAFDPVTARRLGRRLRRPVRRTLDPLPWDSRCLMRSLVLLRMLARRGVVCQLVIGVRPGDVFEAHAWIEHDGRPLLPTHDYAPLTTI